MKKEQANIKGLDENDTKLVNTLGKDVVKAKYTATFSRCKKKSLMTTLMKRQ